MVKNSDLIQMGALLVIGFIAYEKFAKAKVPFSAPSIPQTNTPGMPDFGVTNPNDSTWGDSGLTMMNPDSWVTGLTQLVGSSL